MVLPGTQKVFISRHGYLIKKGVAFQMAMAQYVFRSKLFYCQEKIKSNYI